MRLVDADALREDMQWSIDHGMYDKPYDYLAEIDDAPTIDAVQVVRCENCIFCEKVLSIEGFCRNHESIVYLNDFCPYGERREGGEA